MSTNPCALDAPAQLAVLDWYDAHARDLPWRIGPQARAAGQRPDPYRVWVSEVMLQQTNAATVRQRFADFLHRFPDLARLADAPQAEVLAAWSGLGYYARARNMHRAARLLADAGGFPQTAQDMRAFPGFGPYTSAAIAAIAFDQPVLPVDTNVARILIRRMGCDLTGTARTRWTLEQADRIEVSARAGDLAQALMDLGARICLPRAPDCPACPLRPGCVAGNSPQPNAWPTKTPKAARPSRQGWALVLRRAEHIWLEQRPAKGLLAGMEGLPGTRWDVLPTESPHPALPPMPVDPLWTGARAMGAIEHVFTHFALTLQIGLRDLDACDPQGGGAPLDLPGRWCAIADLPHAALPSVFAKAIERALGTA